MAGVFKDLRSASLRGLDDCKVDKIGEAVIKLVKLPFERLIHSATWEARINEFTAQRHSHGFFTHRKYWMRNHWYLRLINRRY